MTATLSTRKQRQASARQRLRTAKLDAARDAAIREESRAEDIAPAAQRLGVIVAGETYRQPRLERDGVTFIVSSPINHLFRRGGVTKAQKDAAERLSRAWEDGGRGVAVACSSYGERTGGTPQSGWISEAALARMAYLNRQKAEFEGACAWMGGLFPCIRAVVLDGMAITVWADREKRNRQIAQGYFIAGLDRLVEYYVALRERDEAGPARIRSVRVKAP